MSAQTITPVTEIGIQRKDMTTGVRAQYVKWDEDLELKKVFARFSSSSRQRLCNQKLLVRFRAITESLPANLPTDSRGQRDQKNRRHTMCHPRNNERVNDQICSITMV
jgi:hypothetical protein